MNHPFAKSVSLRSIYLVELALLLPLILPAGSPAQPQTELRANKQIVLETARGARALRQGPDGSLYVLTGSVKPPSALWKSDGTGSSMRQILGGGPEPTVLRFPKDLAVDKDGNAIVVDRESSIKIFSSDGKLINSFAFAQAESVGVLRDGRILVSGHGLPQGHLISVFDHQGTSLGTIGEPAKGEGAPGPGLNAILNIGNIVTDDDDNIYFIFRYLLTPTVRKYTPEGKLAAEWHPESVYLSRIIPEARKLYETSLADGDHGVRPLLTAGAFDADTKTLWVSSGPEVMQLDSSGKTVRDLQLVGTDGAPLPASGLLVDRDFICAATLTHGVFEFSKPH